MGPMVFENVPACTLGEGPHWDHATSALWWVDIDGGKIHRHDAAAKATRTLSLPFKISFAVPDGDMTVIAGLDRSIARVDLLGGTYEILADLPESAGNVRLNDGKCDANGRLWAGTMPLGGENDAAQGRLYSWDGVSLVDRDGPFGLANGKDWSVDGTLMYFADTHGGVIWRYAYDKSTGAIGGKQPFIEIDGRPDGLCTDSEGNIYVAIYGGARVDVFDSRGHKTGAIDLPAPNVTSCAFGGPALDILFITTAKVHRRNGGDLYAILPGATGKPAVRARM